MEDIRMKKTYINPELQVVKLQTMQMLAGSPVLDSSEYVPGEDVILGREFTLEEEDFGEEDFESYE